MPSASDSYSCAHCPFGWSSRWPLSVKPPVPITAVLFLGHVDTCVVLVALQVVPVLDEFIGVELMGCDQVTVLTARVRHPPMVEKELVWRGHRIDAQLCQADPHINILQVQPAYAERGLVDQLSHVP